jgi:DeoR/GlpR family transcriptional regulator of sugar metabolism
MDTIRRDLDFLADRQLLARTHGGAMRPGELATADTSFDSRAAVHRRAKEAIGIAAAERINDGETLVINGGTTTLAVARALSAKRDLTVVTNNLRMPAELPVQAVRDLHIIGGTCRIASNVTVGPVAFPGSEGITADAAVIGVGGVSPDGGLSTTNLPEAQMMRQMIDACARVIVVADSSKFGRSAFIHICGLDRMSVLVTDAEPPADVAAALVEAEVEVVVTGAQS